MPERLLAFIRPPESASPETVRRWRWNVALTLMMFWLFAGFAISPLGFVRAQGVDTKIREALDPIQKQVAAVDSKVEAVGQDLTETRKLLLRKLQRDLEREIAEAKTRQCKAATVELADYFRKLVSDKQIEYHDLVGRDFPVPTCAEA